MDSKQKRLARRARPEILWAVIIVGCRHSRVHWSTISSTRIDALNKYRKIWIRPEVADEHLAAGGIRVARVRVEEESHGQ